MLFYYNLSPEYIQDFYIGRLTLKRIYFCVYC